MPLATAQVGIDLVNFRTDGFPVTDSPAVYPNFPLAIGIEAPRAVEDYLLALHPFGQRIGSGRDMHPDADALRGSLPAYLTVNGIHRGRIGEVGPARREDIEVELQLTEHRVQLSLPALRKAPPGEPDGRFGIVHVPDLRDVLHRAPGPAGGGQQAEQPGEYPFGVIFSHFKSVLSVSQS